MRIRLLPFIALAAIVLLAGCGRFSLNTADISVGLDPTMLTYSVDQEGLITVNPNTVTFTSKPGSVGAIIDGYRIDFFDASGNLLIEGGRLISGPLNVRVPAGLQCDTPDVSGSCSINDPGARFAPRSAEPVPIVTLTVDFVMTHLQQRQQGSPPGARAEITFSGRDDNGRDFDLTSEASIEEVGN